MEKLPWEPTINSRISREYFEHTFTPNDGDSCECCGTNKFENNLIVSDGRSCFCSWECLIKQAEKFPEHYNIQDKGVY